jgi:V/A-type H+-transporting ATPase subunit E
LKDELARLIEAVKDEGVGKGREARDRMISDAKADAAKIVGDARDEADRIVSDAHNRSTAVMKNLDQQMSLAMRDLILKAKNELEELVALRPLRKQVAGAMSDPEFMKKLIFRIISDFTKQRTSKEQSQLHIVIPEDMKKEFMKEWLAMMRSDLDVHATLHAEKGLEGFKLFREGGGGELIADTDSMIDIMGPFVSERFRRILEQEAGTAD